MFKHVHYPQSRRSLASEDGNSKSSGASNHNSSSSDSSSSRSSSALSVNESQMGTIKVFCGILRPDIDYKTLIISSEETTKDIIHVLLRKCKMRNRDPNLYYLSMEISTQRHSGQLLETTLVLDDESCPLELKTYQPNGYSVRFTMRCRKGGLLKVYDSCLNSNSQYKSLLISQRTSAEEVIQLLLSCYDSIESPDNFALFEVCHMPHYSERQLLSQDIPLLVREKWSDENYEFHLRRISDFQPPSSTKHLPWYFTTQQKAAIMGIMGVDANFLKAKKMPEVPCQQTCQNYVNYVYI